MNFIAKTLIIIFTFSTCFAQKKVVNSILKDVYKESFKVGVAVNPALISGQDKLSQDIVLKHFNSITALLKDMPVCVKLLTGSSVSKERKAVLKS